MPNAASQSPPTLPDSLGELLGNLRRTSGATQADIAVRLRLTIAQIKALEEDRVEGFPAPPYYLRAARSYAYHFDVGEAFDAWVCRPHDAPHPLDALASQNASPVRIVLVSERHKIHRSGAEQRSARTSLSDGSLRQRRRRLLRTATTGISLTLGGVAAIAGILFTESRVTSHEARAPQVATESKEVRVEPVVLGSNAATPAQGTAENPAAQREQFAPLPEVQQPQAADESLSSPCHASFGRWIAAWNAIDFRGYIASYSREFKYEGGGYEQFARGRNAVFSRKTFINIEVSAVAWSRMETQPSHWVAEFHQRYRSNDYTWEGNKRVLWHSTPGGCRIVAETSS